MATSFSAKAHRFFLSGFALCAAVACGSSDTRQSPPSDDASLSDDAAVDALSETEAQMEKDGGTDTSVSSDGADSATGDELREIDRPEGGSNSDAASDAATATDDAPHDSSISAGPDGGTIVVGSNIRLEIPPGALAGETRFTFTPVSSLGSLASGLVLVPGTTARIDWTGAGFVFNSTLKVIIQPAAAATTQAKGSLVTLAGPSGTDAAAAPNVIIVQCPDGTMMFYPDTSGMTDSYESDGVGFDENCRGAAATDGGSKAGSVGVGVVQSSSSTYPIMTAQPSSITRPVPMAASFAAAASGALPLTYQWRRNGLDIPAATGPTYTLASTQLSDDGAKFWLVVSNAYGAAPSERAVLRVTGASSDGGTADGGASSPITEFPVHDCAGITAGPDGNVWFAEYNAIAKIAPDGVVTEFPIADSSSGTISGITLGPDGNLWFTEYWRNKIGRMTTSGTLSEFSVPSINCSAPPRSCGPSPITPGPDGNLWFTEWADNPQGQKIGHVTPGGVVTELPYPNRNLLSSVVAGPDGNLWLTEYTSPKVVARVTPAGVVTGFPILSNNPTAITAGPDGALWYTTSSAIGRITTAGAVTEFAVKGNFYRHGIVAGPDGNFWFTEYDVPTNTLNMIGRITTQGVVTEFPTPSPSTVPDGIAAGPDGNIWFCETGGPILRVGRLTLPAGP